MKIPSSIKDFGPKVKNNAANAHSYVKQKLSLAGSYVKEQSLKAGSSLKELSTDTVNFVKKNPKQTAAAVAVGAGAVLLYNGIKNAIENKRMMNFQKEMFTQMLSTQNDEQKTVLRNVVKKQAAALKANHETIQELRSKLKA